MVQFSGYMHVLPQTEEEEFEGMARALSLQDLSDDYEVEIWFVSALTHREDTEEFREKLLEKAKEIKTLRSKIEIGLGEFSDKLRDACDYSVNSGEYITICEVKDFNDSKIEVDYKGIRYIITIESESGLEKDNSHE